MYVTALLNLVWASSLFSFLVAVPSSGNHKPSSSSSSCKLNPAASEKRCRSPDGFVCSGRGTCDCGVCLCEVKEAGKYYGPLCECHDWVCHTYDGQVCAGHGSCDCGKCQCDAGWSGEACQYPATCDLNRKQSNEMCRNSQGVICSNAGHGKCYCGNCYCAAGWHGDKCEFQCDITPWEIKKRCTSPDGKICSNRGTCICGECTCHDVDPTGDWGDIHGDTCECDERNCKSVYDRYSDDFCSGHGQCNCGQCDCKDGWAGRKCEHPRSCSLSIEESKRKCQGSSSQPCSGRGKCECGVCTCFPPGDNRVHGKNCECDDRQCENLEGVICGKHGTCSCGRCICEAGWFGKLCQHERKCNMTEEESKSHCESADGVLCSAKGSCHCGKCICSPQEWYISGEFCECDDRECDKHDGLICTVSPSGLQMCGQFPQSANRWNEAFHCYSSICSRNQKRAHYPSPPHLLALWEMRR
uniref:Integrin beta-like protein 1 n=1 Tax=Leptobrachium leishanense TaxID=445787 RepID=A0A8C5LW71_9ANUR